MTNNLNGFLVIDKPSNYTSRDVVNIVSKYFHTKKVGHTGTLDPLATGILIITLGKYTKLSELVTNYDKEYIAQLTLGIQTDTYDIEGKIIKEKKCQSYNKTRNKRLSKSLHWSSNPRSPNLFSCQSKWQKII